LLVVDPDGAIYVGDTMGTIRGSHDHGQTFEDWQAIEGDASSPGTNRWRGSYRGRSV
jgi:hypothetical protein